MRAWLNLHNPPACSSFKTVAGAKFELACQTSTPSQRFERRLRMPFKRGAANANFSNLTSTRWAVKTQHDPIAPKPPAQPPPAQPPIRRPNTFTAAYPLAVSSSSLRPQGARFPGSVYARSVVAWFGARVVFSWHSLSVYRIQSSAHSVASLLQLSDSRLAQSTAVSRERRV